MNRLLIITGALALGPAATIYALAGEPGNAGLIAGGGAFVLVLGLWAAVAGDER